MPQTYVRTDAHRANLSKSLKGKAATTGMSGKHHSPESKQKSSLTHLSKKVPPWQTHAVQKNISCVELWKKLDIVYNHWVTIGNCGHRKICNAMGIPIASSVENMIRWIRKNGNPQNSTEWVLFVNTHTPSDTHN